MKYRAICKCGKDLNDVKSEVRGFIPSALGYPIDFFGGRVSTIRPDFVCDECGTVHEVYYEANESGTIAIASKITKASPMHRDPVGDKGDKGDVITTISKKETVEPDEKADEKVDETPDEKADEIVSKPINKKVK